MGTRCVVGHPVFGGFFFLWELCLVWGYRMCILPSFSACLISVVISSVVPPRQTQLLFLLLSSSNETCRFEVPLKLLLTFRIRRLYSKIGHPPHTCSVSCTSTLLCRSLWSIGNLCFHSLKLEACIGLHCG